MGEITFTLETVPTILQAIIMKLENLEQKIDDLKNSKGRNDDVWFNMDELCEYLPSRPARQTVYGWTSNHSIPYHKNGKCVVFKKAEIDEWLLKGEVKSQQDLMQEAILFVNSKKKGRL